MGMRQHLHELLSTRDHGQDNVNGINLASTTLLWHEAM